MPMTMRKAIEILDLNAKVHNKKMPPDVLDALALALATMRAVVYIRGGGNWSWSAPLPDEELEAKNAK